MSDDDNDVNSLFVDLEIPLFCQQCNMCDEPVGRCLTTAFSVSKSQNSVDIRPQ